MVYEVEKLKIKERGKNCNFKLCIIGKRGKGKGKRKGPRSQGFKGARGKDLKERVQGVKGSRGKD
jgi:hypothetical protein